MKTLAHNQSARARRGLTLIEVIVSIGIVAILLGILAPALSRSRESARRVACLANLHSFGQAIQMYREDHDGALPFARAPYTLAIDEPDRDEPLTSLAPYFDVEPPHHDGAGQVVTGPPFVCPSDPRLAEEVTGFSYIYFPYLHMGGAYVGVAAKFGYPPPEPEHIEQLAAKQVTQDVYQRPPSREPVLADWQDWHEGGPPATDQPAFQDRNGLLFNGAVGWLVRAETPAR